MQLATCLLLVVSAASLLTGCRGPQSTSPSPAFTVTAAAETSPVASSGDAADDPAVWFNSPHPDQSRVIGTNKKGGLAVYDLEGKELQFLPVGRVNNVDLRQAVPTPAGPMDLVAASHRERKGITLCRVTPAGLLEELAGSPLPTSVEEPYGLCCWLDSSTNRFSVFVNDKSGRVEQWIVVVDTQQKASATFARSWKLSSQVEGMVADDQTGSLFIGEEAVGVWHVDLRAASAVPTRVASATAAGPLVADVEGVALATTARGPILLVSSQGSNSYAVYAAKPPFEPLGSFRISAGALGSVEETDGIEVCQRVRTPRFPTGLFVAQDGLNEPRPQNFKMVSWTDIEAGLGK
ncbi:MAG: phytase [Phycisphaerales bacterium]